MIKKEGVTREQEIRRKANERREPTFPRGAKTGIRVSTVEWHTLMRLSETFKGPAGDRSSKLIK